MEMCNRVSHFEKFDLEVYIWEQEHGNHTQLFTHPSCSPAYIYQVISQLTLIISTVSLDVSSLRRCCRCNQVSHSEKTIQKYVSGQQELGSHMQLRTHPGNCSLYIYQVTSSRLTFAISTVLLFREINSEYHVSRQQKPGSYVLFIITRM